MRVTRGLGVNLIIQEFEKLLSFSGGRILRPIKRKVIIQKTCGGEVSLVEQNTIEYVCFYSLI